MPFRVFAAALLLLLHVATASAQSSLRSAAALETLRRGMAGRSHVVLPAIGEVRLIAVRADGQQDDQLVDRLRNDGWLRCDGKRVPIATYGALFAAIGHDWEPAGSSTDADTFALPDLATVRGSTKSARGRLVYFIHSGMASPGEPIAAASSDRPRAESGP